MEVLQDVKNCHVIWQFKTGYQRDICTPMFIAALFTIAKK